MSSKNLNKKSDDKNDKAEQQALKEVEIVAEIGPNEKTRKEAEELIETVESSSSSTVQEQEQEAIETVLDETKKAIKKTVSEEIPKYIKTIGDLQEGTIQATKEIGYDCIELQREAASLVPQLQERYMSYCVPWMSPMIVTEYYSRMVDNFVDNAISATNLANNLVMVSMEGIQHLTDTNREFWRVGVENARTISKSLAEA